MSGQLCFLGVTLASFCSAPFFIVDVLDSSANGSVSDAHVPYSDDDVRCV